MTRAMVALLLVPVLCAQGCARAPAASAAPKPIIVQAANVIAVRPGPRLTSLPLGQRYRFVPPDSLTIDLAAADVESFYEPGIERLRKSFAAVMARGRWVESEDSAQFDVTIFETSRTSLSHSTRVNFASNFASCGAPSTQLQLCTDDPMQYTESWSTEYTTLYIIRRRADGAVRVWRRGGAKAAAALLEKP
jgi:hypothetical protein